MARRKRKLTQVAMAIRKEIDRTRLMKEADEYVTHWLKLRCKKLSNKFKLTKADADSQVSVRTLFEDEFHEVQDQVVLIAVLLGCYNWSSVEIFRQKLLLAINTAIDDINIYLRECKLCMSGKCMHDKEFMCKPMWKMLVWRLYRHIALSQQMMWWNGTQNDELPCNLDYVLSDFNFIGQKKLSRKTKENHSNVGRNCAT